MSEDLAFVLDLWGILLYGSTQAQDFLEPTSTTDISLAYKKKITVDKKKKK